MGNSYRPRYTTSLAIRERAKPAGFFQTLPTTLYHPKGNGLVEHFNGTLKEMIRRMCQESTENWDRYLATLLLAQRQVPQTSLGLSPFDLCGRYVRGPITTLKQLWSRKHLDDETKTTYGKAIELQEGLQYTCEFAYEALQEAKVTRKQYD